MSDFLPRRDADLVQWASIFDQRLNSAPDKFNIPEYLLIDFHALRLQFAAAFTVAATPDTRTKIAITTKLAARAAMVPVVRVIQGILKSNPDIPDADLVGLGLKVRRVGKAAKLPTITEAPTVMLLSREGWTATVKLFDGSGRIRRRLRGTSGAVLMVAAGERVSRSTQWENAILTSKTIATVSFPTSYPIGAPVLISVQWVSTRGECGPRAIISTWVAGGASVAA